MLDVLNTIALLCQIHSNNMDLIKYQDQCQVRILSCYEDVSVSNKSDTPNEKGLILARCLKSTKEGAK